MPRYLEKPDFAENRYYRLNRILLSMIKLWPYEQSTFIQIERIVIITLMLSVVVFQLTTFLTFKYTMEICIMVLSYAIPCLLCNIQYYLFYINSDKVKQIWEDMHHGWKALKDQTEYNIMRRYLRIAKYKAIRLTLLFTIGSVAYAFIQFSPIILDMIFPLNETRPRKLYVSMEYFVDDRTYYYPMLCHWLIGVFVYFTVIVSIIMFQMMYIHYICGLLDIASYRIEHSVDEYATSDPQLQNDTAHQRISTAVEIHRKALKCADFFRSAFGATTITNIIFIVTSLSLNLFRLLNAIILLENMIDLISSVLFVFVHFLMMFLAQRNAQQITDHNSKIFNNVYSVKWYMAPIKIQKLLLFIMKKTTKTYVVSVGNIFVSSIESFAKLSSLSISYFTVLYSIMK